MHEDRLTAALSVVFHFGVHVNGLELPHGTSDATSLLEI